SHWPRPLGPARVPPWRVAPVSACEVVPHGQPNARQLGHPAAMPCATRTRFGATRPIAERSPPGPHHAETGQPPARAAVQPPWDPAVVEFVGASTLRRALPE